MERDELPRQALQRELSEELVFVTRGRAPYDVVLSESIGAVQIGMFRITLFVARIPPTVSVTCTAGYRPDNKCVRVCTLYMASTVRTSMCVHAPCTRDNKRVAGWLLDRSSRQQPRLTCHTAYGCTVHVSHIISHTMQPARISRDSSRLSRFIL
eukprot:COSAG01_NODE_2024_length_8608_cov_32.124574_4_plen_154_part_00